MKNELLKYLKSSIDRDWLQYYSLDSMSNHEINEEKYCSQALYQLTQHRLAEISAVAIKQPGKSVVFIVEQNPVNFIAAFLAGVIAEVNLFLCDPAWKQQEWRQVFNLIEPDLIYADRTTQDLIAKVGSTVINYADDKSNLSGSALIMIPTGGTSGKIRFAMHSWDTLRASVTGFRDYFNCQQINSCCTLPLYHVSGLMQFMRSFVTQGNLLVCPYQIVKTKQITLDKWDYFISLVPTQLKFLLESIPDWLTQFKTVLLGGAPATRSLLDTAREYNITIALTYGMTETASGIVTLKPEDFLAGNNSSGRVLSHAQVNINHLSVAETAGSTEVEEVLGEEVKDKPANIKSQNIKHTDDQINRIGLIGLIEISCTSLCLGYYPELFTPGQPLVTDDLGYFDQEGYLHLIGRNSQKIITGGKNVFPAEVEEAIYATKLVKDVCIIGIPDQKWGQAVTAIYIPIKSEINLDLIKHKATQQIAKYKLPKNWIKVDSIPRNNRGKINYQKLKMIAIKTVET